MGRMICSRNSHILSKVIIAVFLVCTLLPIVLMFQQSIKPTLLMFSDPPQYLFEPTGRHFAKIVQKNSIFKSVFNSITIAALSTALCIAFSAGCGYTLARLRVPGERLWTLVILMSRMVPAAALMMPLYIIMLRLGLGGTGAAVVLAHMTLNLPFAVWLIRGFFKEIPRELEQAAKVDGASPFVIFLKICLPLVRPGIVTAAIMTLLTSWNEFMFALILGNRDTRTLPVAISSFVGSVSIDWGGSSAAAVLACIPVFLAGIYLQKHLVRGLTAGAVKG